MTDKEQIQVSLHKLNDYLYQMANIAKRGEYEELLRKIKIVNKAMKICEEYL